MFPLLKTGRIIEKNGGKIYTAAKITGKIIEQFGKTDAEVQIYDKFPCFADSKITRRKRQPIETIIFSGEILQILEQESSTAKEILFELAFHFEKQILEGLSEPQAFEKLFCSFRSISEKDKKTVIDALDNPEIDPGNAFKNFLEEYPESTEKERIRLTSLLRAGTLVDIPYDRQRARRVEKKFKNDLPSLRLETLNVLSDTYEPSVDHENADRVFRHCLENGKRLLVCRFGRAFYTDALLVADSKGVRSKEIRKDVTSLYAGFGKLTGLEGAREIGPELQRVINLAAGDWFSLAGIRGALKKLKQVLRNLELNCIEEFDETHGLDRLKETRRLIDGFRSAVHHLEQAIDRSDKFEPAYVSFISRIHELDAINIVRVNELRDPFAGENPEMEALIAATGHNCTISPNPGAWLPYASDWVEALPAYAHYMILPQNGSYKVVALTEREILEIIYKTSADEWAKNIEDVVNRENVSVARRLVAKRYGCKYEKEKDIISFIRRNRKEMEVGRVACLIEKTAERKCRDIAQLQEQGNSRVSALFTVAGSMERAVEESTDNPKTKLYARIACERKRPLPNVHVLTTLGPTETETNITNWLEEAMSLYLIERAHGLGDEVRKKMSSYRDSTGKIALQVAGEQEMEGELLRIMGERGLRNTRPDRMNATLLLCSLYPEIARETNLRIAGLNQIPDVSSHGIRDYIGPLAGFTARREVIREKGLLNLMDDGRYRYSSSGPYKRYNLAYTPSRVDLGPEIIESVRNVPKWVGGDGHEAAKSSGSLYSLFNLAGVTTAHNLRVAEFLKVGENFFTRFAYLSVQEPPAADYEERTEIEFFQ